MQELLEDRIGGTLRSAVILEFLKNSFHFPLANILLELVLEGPAHYLASPDFYVSLFAPAVQAWFLGRWSYAGTPRPLAGNLIGPALYTAVDLATSPAEYVAMPFHYAYWGFSLAIGLIQWARLRAGEGRQAPLILLENMVRSSILGAMYWFVEVLTEQKYADPGVFLASKSHVFILLALLFLSVVVGLQDARSQGFLDMLRGTARQLRTFSRWLLGRSVLSLAMTDPRALSLVRRERAVAFMDIRGFTSWSERQPPETVVNMLNGYYEVAESVFTGSGVILVKYTADEVMAFFADTEEAARVAHAMHTACGKILEAHGLTAGTGLHVGLVVEGLLGSRDMKRYEIIGDTVNTAKRVCSAAAGREFLVTEAVLPRITGFCDLLGERLVEAKGKAEPLRVYAVSVRAASLPRASSASQAASVEQSGAS